MDQDVEKFRVKSESWVSLPGGVMSYWLLQKRSHVIRISGQDG